ncbi:MAG: hypothetical protein ACR2KW_04420 [Rubrobacter sp.]
MRFIGCAPAWRPGEAKEKVSCLVVLDERGGIVSNAFVEGEDGIAPAIEAAAGGSGGRGEVIVGLDAPLSVPNERGTRKVERVLARVSLPAYSASRRMFGGEPVMEGVLEALEKNDIEYTDYPLPGQEARCVVEVDSAATLKVLALERGGEGEEGDVAERLKALPEARFRKGNKGVRAEALRAAIAILWDTKGLRLRTGNLSGDLTARENIDVSKLDVTEKVSHAELDRVVGLVEAILSAYTVHRHWKGRDGSVVVGVGDEGSVLLSANDALREALIEECRVFEVAYV